MSTSARIHKAVTQLATTPRASTPRATTRHDTTNLVALIREDRHSVAERHQGTSGRDGSRRTVSFCWRAARAARVACHDGDVLAGRAVAEMVCRACELAPDDEGSYAALAVILGDDLLEPGKADFARSTRARSM